MTSTHLPTNVFKTVLSYCAPAHTLHKKMWSRIRVIIANTPCENGVAPIDRPVQRYAFDSVTGKTGKSILTKNSWVHANYDRCWHCRHLIWNDEGTYHTRQHRFPPRQYVPDHSVEVEFFARGHYVCRECLCTVCGDVDTSPCSDGNKYCEGCMPDDFVFCDEGCDTFHAPTRMNIINGVEVCRDCLTDNLTYYLNEE